MTDEQYRSKPPGFTSNIGGHVRHCLDHVDALLRAIERGQLNYDSRCRGTEVETCRQAALDAIARQEEQLHELQRHAEEQPLHLTALMGSALPAFEFGTTVGRE